MKATDAARLKNVLAKKELYYVLMKAWQFNAIGSSRRNLAVDIAIFPASIPCRDS